MKLRRRKINRNLQGESKLRGVCQKRPGAWGLVYPLQALQALQDSQYLPHQQVVPDLRLENMSLKHALLSQDALYAGASAEVAMQWSCEAFGVLKLSPQPGQSCCHQMLQL